MSEAKVKRSNNNNRAREIKSFHVSVRPAKSFAQPTVKKALQIQNKYEAKYSETQGEKI
jgi:hypothetical protein